MGLIWQLLLSFFAAFGVFCVGWVLFGWLLPVCREGWILCPGRPGKLAFVQIYLWLRGMGMVRCPLVLLDLGLGDWESKYLENQGIEICSPAQLAQRLGIGAETN